MRPHHRLRLVLALSLVSFSAFAQARIESVTPNTGPVSGGTEVIIKISGFGACNPCPPVAAPYRVFFGGQRATSVQRLDQNTVAATTPEHFPGSVRVQVELPGHPQPNYAELDNAFTYTGAIGQAFEPLLFPILMRPVRGAFGSEFRTEGRIANQGHSPLSVYGLDSRCFLADPPMIPDRPFELMPFAVWPMYPECAPEGVTGRVLWVPRGRVGNLAANVRVYEQSKQAENHGVEMPVVRERDFRGDRILFINVPAGPRFRLTLRVYTLGTNGQLLRASMGSENVPLPFTQSSDPFTPSVAVVQLPSERFATGSTQTVTIEAPSVGIPLPPPIDFWAFITVTNNDTQHITTITPH
jgi:IPT/TIG domain